MKTRISEALKAICIMKKDEYPYIRLYFHEHHPRFKIGQEVMLVIDLDFENNWYRKEGKDHIILPAKTHGIIATVSQDDAPYVYGLQIGSTRYCYIHEEWLAKSLRKDKK